MQSSWSPTDLLVLATLRDRTSTQRVDDVRRYASLDEALDASPTLFAIRTQLEAVRERAAADLERWAARGIRMLTPFDDAYPMAVHRAVPPPFLLFVRGTITDQHRVAVVGTRRSTDWYGRPVTDAFVRTWCEAGISIVSGLATGIDTYAHRAAIESGAHTIAVVAGGVDRVSPSTAAAMADRIIDAGGAVVSEYLCGQKALPAHFPVRNRIITALSDAVVVVESNISGGSMISVEFAGRQGVPVYAVPGPVTSSRSAGTNAIIADGRARCLAVASDLLRDMGIPVLAAAVRNERRTDLSADAQRILDACDQQPLHPDAIARALHLSIADVLAALSTLECNGLVQRRPGNLIEVVS